MPYSNTHSTYGGVAKTFHWLTALLMFTVIPVGYFANELAHAITDPAITTTEADLTQAAFLFSLHKTLGVILFFVAIARVLWALTQPKPGLLNADNIPEAFAAETIHWLLYGSLILAPLSGWIHHAATTGFAPIWLPFGQSLPFVPKDPAFAEFMSGLHYVFVWTLIAALALHIAGALKHHIIDRDSTLRRMLPGAPDIPELSPQTHSGMPLVAALLLWGAAFGVGTFIGVFDHSASHTQSAELEAVQSDWVVQDGTLALSVTQMGSPVTGSFADWTAAITFDEPETPGPAGSVDVTIAIGSISLGSVTSQAVGKDFFDAATYPTATFKADLFKTETGYEARGPLTIRDKSIDIILPFTLDQQENTAIMTAETHLNRLDYGVGSHMPDEGSLAFGVTVSVTLTATRSE
ncbi:cytochrome [Phaeobacter gallaeciensis]|uniref:Cytochrome n=2 Tax=Roseobacteraceae TaxID=2854170 RepID=A0A366WTP7_9RHOB|nr:MULTISPECIES: cytochrome b/b6 domain-containing protein [Roseobacteraceae]MBT3140743.1 cytochrome b/b6 domain-containing protein [Falsiruegeria litorea]MBT8170487.1 cytochrome b/b6 domain-containing protein [Falsiruegeria litorea]RBW52703.1 cytochrome [Phaeobacter gallaeciensis]